MASDDALIHQTINLYGLALDARRWDLFAQVFTPELHADYRPGGVWHDLVTFTADFARLHDRYDHTQHAVSNHVIRVDGREATAFSYVAWRLAVTSEDEWRGREGSAWYDDLLVRTEAGWRICDRRCRVTWSQPIASSGAADRAQSSFSRLPVEKNCPRVLAPGTPRRACP